MKIAVNTTSRTLPLNLPSRQEGDKLVRREEMLMPFGTRDSEGKLLDRIEVSDEEIKSADLACLLERGDMQLQKPEEVQPVAEAPADDVSSVKSHKKTRS